MAYPDAALWFLISTLPIALWVAWSDMATMKIPNKAVVALTLVYAVVGVLVLPLPEYLWRWTHLVVVLVIGFLLNLTGGVGAGDAKFAAAMAPFFALSDWLFVLILFSIVLMAAFLTHRGARRIPAIRRAFPTWESWTRKDFPMGLALSGTLLAYFVLALRTPALT
jgi:prepilin peptidase CpaA